MFEESTDWGEEASTCSLLHSALFSDSEDATDQVSTSKRKKHSGRVHDDEVKNPRKKGTHDQQRVGGSGAKSQPTKMLLKKKSKLQAKLKSRMEGARFRWINEQLYTTTGKQARRLFEEDPELFRIYHDGFSTQVSKWPVNPLERVISYVNTLPTEMVIADFGCGEAKLAQSVPHQVFSFDLVACNSQVIACDMANVPLEDKSVDVCVFCLSLMGTNVSDFIKEAKRVLVKSGRLKICEIVSRMPSVDEFVSGVESFGFKLVSKEMFSTMFIDFDFKASGRKAGKETRIILKPCNYKRR